MYTKGISISLLVGLVPVALINILYSVNYTLNSKRKSDSEILPVEVLD